MPSASPSRCELIARLPDRRTGRPPLLFVHGALCGAWCWDVHWLREAARQGWPAYALSLRGHGESPGREELGRFGLRHYVEDVLEIARSLPEPPVLVGHSMGGLLVQKAASRLPVPAAVLLASISAYGGWETGLAILRHNPLDLLRIGLGIGPSPLKKRGYGFSDRVPDELVQQYQKRMGPESLRAQYELMAPRSPRRLEVPVLVIAAGEDRLVPLGAARRTAKAYGARLEVFQGMGHNLMLEPGWLEPLQAMLSWLEAVLPAPAARRVAV